ncbi:MAG: hypothetical protein J3Q66DRAFT_346721 [Benniella sp.]|nr:MAG: hypothetical protein J3Q66DRAFT_346721 [Benniella sp.]
MDKDLMAIMGLEDDEPKDQGLAPAPTVQDESPSSSQDILDILESSSSQSQPPLAVGSSGDISTTSRPQSRPRTSIPSSDRSSSPPLFSPEFNPFGIPPGKVRAFKAKKNKAQADRASAMFSPTLSPRKVKKKSKPPTSHSSNVQLSLDSSPSPLPSTASSPVQGPTRVVPRDSRSTTVPSSPQSSLSLQKACTPVSWESDSDVSPFDMKRHRSPSRRSKKNIVLHASIPSNTFDTVDTTDTAHTVHSVNTLDMEMSTPTKPVNTTKDLFLDRLDDLDNSQDSAGEDLDLTSKNGAEAKGRLQGLSLKEILQLQQEKEQMLRTSSLSIPRRTVKKDLSSLMKDVQASLDSKRTARRPGGSEWNTAASSSSKPKPLTIALDDYSDDEAEQDAERNKEYAQWKLSISKAVLAASIPKDRQRDIMNELKQTKVIAKDRRLEIEKTLQMSPLYNDIQKMSLHSDEPSTSTALASPWTFHSTRMVHPNKTLADSQRRPMISPSKTQGSKNSFTQFQEEWKRTLFKKNTERRKRLEEEAKRSGTFKSPEDHATDQLKDEEERRRGIDFDKNERDEAGVDGDVEDEEDGDYDPQGTPDRASHHKDEDDEMEMDLGSADEDQVDSVESEDEEGDLTDMAKVAFGDQDERTANLDGEGKAEESEEDEEEEEIDEEEDSVLTTKRPTKKRTIIGDEDEVKVVVIDRSRAPSPSDREHDDDESDVNDDEESEGEEEEGEDEEDESGSNAEGEDNDDDGDVSDIDRILDDTNDTQGFGAFFESSIDPAKPMKTKAAQQKGRLSLNDTQNHDVSPIQTLTRPTPYIISPVTESDADQVQSCENGASLSGALDLLSGKFVSTTPQSSDPDVSTKAHSDSLADISSAVEQTAGVDLPTKAKNAFDILTKAIQKDDPKSSQAVPGLRRLQKKVREKRVPISKNEKSAFIEYEAEEEEDEFMGMGGVDYESDNDQDDYDLADGMVDTTTTLNKQDMENVRQLHMKHEQDQHNKDISDLVQGIAAGNLWKRRSGQVDDLDLFDEEDMVGRFHMKKKLKVTESFEKLADNPVTAAFARAFQKHADDDQIFFLSEPEESNDKVIGSKQDNDEDEDMEHVEYEKDDHHLNLTSNDTIGINNAREEEEEEEPLNTDKRKERQRLARLRRHDYEGSMDPSMTPGIMAEMTKNQVLPFDTNPNEQISVSMVASSTTTTLYSVPRKPLDREDVADQVQKSHPIDDHKTMMRRAKVIRDIVDGVEDPVDLFGQTSVSPRKSSSFSAFDILDRIVDQPLAGSDTVAGEARIVMGVEDDVRLIALPRTLARQSSSFLVEERRQQFLSTVGEELRGGQASSRVVKEVNRRKMAFATGKAKGSDD